ncbi:MAG: family 20 glycosylhydrolase [Alphaproteobacteria bacterium]|nr:family 20 glycosylhydrolase [Alphaproteobacteria bacterium]
MTAGLRLPAVILFTAPLLFSGMAAAPTPPTPLSLIPEPVQIVMGEGAFALSADTRVVCVPADRRCDWSAKYLSNLLQRTRGMSLGRPGHSSKTDVIVFRRQRGVRDPEGYRLRVRPGAVVVSAATNAGLFYGAVTLWQLATQTRGAATRIDIPALDIVDSPRFAWRGVLLDSARHYQSPTFIKSFIDAMALHKLNVLQWHLTDDQGWRLQIRRYPRLTSVGAWRLAPDGARYGGFYTQTEVRDIVAYARERHVTIVPEIEMPGHSLAAIVAYPGLASIPHPPTRVSGDWGIFPYLYKPDPATFRFLENVLNEVMALFPGRIIHVGGDEAVKDQWNASPRVQQQMRRLHIASADDLQAYFIDHIGRYLEAHGRRLAGWDEILNRHLARNAIVTSWHSVDSAVEGAKLGHDVVLSPSPTLYFDNCQANAADVPPCRGTVVTLQDVYAFDPTPRALDAMQQKHILGVQANIWTEHIRSDDLVGYAAFPRAAALAEMAWTPQAGRDWRGFLARLPGQLDRYQDLGLVYSDSALKVAVAAEPSGGGARLSLSNQAGFGTIRDALNGAAPTTGSQAYTGPFEVGLPARISAAAFSDDRALTTPTIQMIDAASILRRDSHQMRQCTDDLPLSLQVGSDTVMVNVMNPCWVYRGLDLTSIAGFDAAVAQRPFNFQIGKDVAKIPLYPDAAPDGQLEIRLDTCKGELLAMLPLASAMGRGSPSELHAAISPHAGVHDLCFLFARRGIDPVWLLDWVQPLSARQE